MMDFPDEDHPAPEGHIEGEPVMICKHCPATREVTDDDFDC